MMSTSTLLFLIACGQFLLSAQGLIIRLKGKEIIPINGEVVITDLPVGGCRRYDTLECLSDVPYQGKVEKAYWEYTDPVNIDKYHKVNDIHCEGKDCWKFGWQSNMGIYKEGKKYYSVVRLGRRFENATTGFFTCRFKEDSGPSVSVNIVSSVTSESDCGNFTTPTLSENKTHSNNDIPYTISWDAPCQVDSYTFYYTNRREGSCHNETLDADMTSHTVKNVNIVQIAANQNEKTVKCSLIYQVVNGTLEEREDFELNGCTCEEE